MGVVKVRKRRGWHGWNQWEIHCDHCGWKTSAHTLHGAFHRAMVHARRLQEVPC